MTDETELAPPPAETPIAEAPESKEPEQQQKPETETKQPVEETPDTVSDEPEKKKLSGSERLKRQKERLAAELAAERARREELERRLSAQPAPEQKPGVDREPNEDDFGGNWVAYQSAKTAWEVRKALREERAREEQLLAQAKAQEAQLELADEYAEHAETVRERIPDFDEVIARASGIEVSPELVEEIFSAGPKGPLISYYLAQHPEKLRELQKLSGKALAREVGRIEARVHLPQPKKATEATPPLTLPKGGAAPAFDPFKTDDMDAYVKWRQSGGGKKK